MVSMIDRRLNLVIPLERGDNARIYIHSTPVRPETFEKYYLVMSKTFSQFAVHNLDPRSGPSVAAMLLKEVAQKTQREGALTWWEGDDGVGGPSGLMAEMVRLSSVVALQSENNWGTTPLQIALEKNLLDPDEKSEVMNMLTFFTVVSLVAPRVDRPRLVKGMAAIYELLTTSLNSTEYATSLKTSTPDEPSGETAQA